MTQTTKKYIVKCPDCGNEHGSQALHICRGKQCVFIDQNTTDYTLIKVTGKGHEKLAARITGETL